MERRRLLRSSGVLLSAGFAGCLGNETGDDASPGGSGDEGSNGAHGIAHEGEVVETQAVPADVPFEFDVEFTTTVLSSSEIPRFTYTIRNTAEEAHHLDVGGGRNDVVPHFSDPAGLGTIRDAEADHVISAFVDGDGDGYGSDDDVGPEGDPDGCLTVSGIMRDSIYAIHTVEAGEELTGEYALAGSDEIDDDCPPPGTYHLHEAGVLNPDDGDDDPDPTEFEFTIGFTVELD